MIAAHVVAGASRVKIFTAQGTQTASVLRIDETRAKTIFETADHHSLKMGALQRTYRGIVETESRTHVDPRSCKRVQRDQSAVRLAFPRFLAGHLAMTGVENLQHVAQALTTISADTQGRITNWRGEQASLAFAKVGVTCLTFLRLIPGSTYFGPAQNLAIWDLSAAASQCRNLMEAYYLLCYLVFEPPADSEREFRQALWEYHEEFELHEMLRAAVPDSKHLPAVAQEMKRRQARLEANSVFSSLSPGHCRLLLKGHSFKLESAIELSRKAGISEAYYRAQHKYCSAFAHSAPFALSQLKNFRASTPEAKQVLGTLVDTTLAYCVLAIRDFVSLPPDQIVRLDPEISQAIRYWEDILRWEKSPHFAEPVPETKPPTG